MESRALLLYLVFLLLPGSQTSEQATVTNTTSVGSVPATIGSDFGDEPGNSALERRGYALAPLQREVARIRSKRQCGAGGCGVGCRGIGCGGNGCRGAGCGGCRGNNCGNNCRGANCGNNYCANPCGVRGRMCCDNPAPRPCVGCGLNSGSGRGVFPVALPISGGCCQCCMPVCAPRCVNFGGCACRWDRYDYYDYTG